MCYKNILHKTCNLIWKQNVTHFNDKQFVKKKICNSQADY